MIFKPHANYSIRKAIKFLNWTVEDGNFSCIGFQKQESTVTSTILFSREMKAADFNREFAV